jgi:hypothetical protein
VIRLLLIHPLIVAITLALGVAVCKAMNLSMHGREMLQALIIVLAAVELAMVPLLLVRNSSQIAVSQAVLGGMVIHLLIVTGAVALMPFDRPFIFWLAAFYGTTLISLSAMNIVAMRTAPVIRSTSAVADGSNR